MTQGVPGEDEMTSRADATILERILDGREPLLDLMSEYRAAIEKEVRDDIRARVEALPFVRAGGNSVNRAAVLAAISSSSATETQDGERPPIPYVRADGTIEYGNLRHRVLPGYDVMLEDEDGNPATPTPDDSADIMQAATGGPDFTVKDWPDDRDREVERIAAAVHESICTFEDHYVVHPVGGKVGPDQNYWTPCHILNVRALYDAGLRASGGD